MNKSTTTGSIGTPTPHESKKTTNSDQRTVPSKKKLKPGSKDTKETMETQDYKSEIFTLRPDVNRVQKLLRQFVNRIKSTKIAPGGILSDTNITVPEINEICLRGRERFMMEPPLIKTSPGICIFGDIHGQYPDLSNMLEKTGVPPKQRLLFLGDYVDRGQYGVEVITLLTAYKILYPKHIYLLRGNHETRGVNRQYGFIDECRKRYGEKDGNAVWTNFLHMFNSMPMSAVIANKIFCCHGGISENLYDLTQFDQISRPCDITDIGLLCDLIWSDPSPLTKTFDGSPRGISKIFGQDSIKDFCDMTNIDLVIRGHQCVMEGVETSLDDRCITVFSAPFYCQELHNIAGILYIDQKLKVHCYQFKSSFDTTKPKTIE